MKNKIIAELRKLGIEVKSGKIKKSDIKTALANFDIHANPENEFFTENVTIDTYDKLIDGFVSLETPKVSLSWSIDMDVRSWGVKGIGIIIPTQSFELEIEVEDGTTKIIEIKVEEWEANVEGINLSDDLRPRSIELKKLGNKFVGEVDFSQP